MVRNLRASRDGLHWGTPIGLTEATAPQEINYPSTFTYAEERLRPSAGATSSAMQNCTSVDVLFVLEYDAAHLGAPFTRDIDAVSVSFDRVSRVAVVGKNAALANKR